VSGCLGVCMLVHCSWSRLLCQQQAVLLLCWVTLKVCCQIMMCCSGLGMGAAAVRVEHGAWRCALCTALCSGVWMSVCWSLQLVSAGLPAASCVASMLLYWVAAKVCVRSRCAALDWPWVQLHYARVDYA
jgi:hypothetical protein